MDPSLCILGNWRWFFGLLKWKNFGIRDKGISYGTQDWSWMTVRVKKKLGITLGTFEYMEEKNANTAISAGVSCWYSNSQSYLSKVCTFYLQPRLLKTSPLPCNNFCCKRRPFLPSMKNAKPMTAKIFSLPRERAGLSQWFLLYNYTRGHGQLCSSL